MTSNLSLLGQECELRRFKVSLTLCYLILLLSIALLPSAICMIGTLAIWYSRQGFPPGP
jgi:hypothetical protein